MGPGGRHRRGWLGVGVLVVGLALGGLVIVASSSGTVRPVGERPAKTPGLGAATPGLATPLNRGRPGTMPTWFSVMLDVGLVMMLALVGLAVVWMLFAGFRLRRDRAAVAEGERQRADRLAEAVETGLARVESGTPSDAVIACWVALEQAAAAVDVVRRPSETPAEFTARVLGVSEVSLDDLSTLARLYREARYSSHASTEAARSEARAALTRLQHELIRVHSRLARSWR